VGRCLMIEQKQVPQDIADYVRLATEMNANGGLHGFLVVYQKVDIEGKVEICKEVLVVPSFSHIAAMLDCPEHGRSVLDVKYVGVGKVALVGLSQRPMLMKDESTHGDKRNV